MALPTRDDTKSRIDEGYETGLNNGGNNAYVQAGLDQAESYANDPGNHQTQDDIKNAEASGGDSGWNTNLNQGGSDSSGSSAKQKIKRAFKFTKKKGAIAGLLATFGIGGGLLTTIMGPASLLINLTENFSISNDSSSTAMERRFMKTFGNMAGSDAGLCTSGAKLKCKMGRVSNSALHSLSKKGVVADGYDGKRTGYPAKNPASYTIDGKTIQAANLMDELSKKENAKVANKILGRGGAFNLRVKAWTGKHITKGLYGKFNLDRRAALADGSSRGKTSQEKLAGLKERVVSRIPGNDQLNGASQKIKDKIGNNLDKAKKGGPAYLVAVGGCIGIKAPMYIAAGIAGVQLLQLMPFAMDYVLSPGSKAKASGVDTENSIEPEDMETLGLALTNKTENADGEMSSALDSPYLLAAMGVNEGKPPVSEKFTPGYATLTSGVVAASMAANQNEAVKTSCNVIMSPAAMWSAVAVDTAVTAAASATIVGGFIKVAATWAATEIIAQVVQEVGGALASEAIKNAAENDAIPNAQGEELGDVIGLAAMATFSGGGMARHLPVLAEDQLVAYDQVRQENETFHRNMAVASLSPFDTSSRYTFAGSIVRSMQMAYIQGGASPLAMIGSIFRTPTLLSSNALAATNQTANACGYATEFGFDTGDPSSTPAVNAVGMPCTGITPTQAGMSTEEAINLLISEGWLCDEANEDCPDISDEATIEELVSSEYIKKDTMLAEFIASCSDASSGDYMFSSSGCITPKSVAKGKATGGASISTDDGESVSVSDIDLEGATEIEGVKNQRSVQAMSVFLLDYQIVQAVNGFDEEDGSEMTAGNTETTGIVVDGNAQELAQKILDSPNVTYWDQSRDAGDKSRPSDNLRSIAAGELANTSTRGPAGGTSTSLDVNMLRFLAELSEKTSYQINALAGQKHSANSDHYTGTAVDFQCGHDLPDIADSIAQKYGLSRNWENCTAAGNHHWHYSLEVGV